MIAAVSITIPDVLGGSPDDTERFLMLVEEMRPQSRIALDMSAVTWVRPHGAVVLLGACRFLAQLTGHPVRLTSLRAGVHAYLRRIDFFARAAERAYTLDSFDETNELLRSKSSFNLLELIPIIDGQDVYKVGAHARKILGSWLSDAANDIDRIVSLLSEACGNVVDHSGDIGMVTIQKYERGQYADVELAISDFGRGIRNSLIAEYGNIATTPLDYIEQALGGRSARQTGRGGHGLDTIRKYAIESGGSLYLRSESGAVFARSTGVVRHETLSFFPGTQVAVTFRSRLSPGP